MSASTNPQNLSGFDLIQKIYPGAARLFTDQVASLIQHRPESVRNAVWKETFPIQWKKESKAKNAPLVFDVRDVAAYLDAHRSPTKRGRPTKASKLAATAQQGGDHA